MAFAAVWISTQFCHVVSYNVSVHVMWQIVSVHLKHALECLCSMLITCFILRVDHVPLKKRFLSVLSCFV